MMNLFFSFKLIRHLIKLNILSSKMMTRIADNDYFSITADFKAKILTFEHSAYFLPILLWIPIFTACMFHSIPSLVQVLNMIFNFFKKCIYSDGYIVFFLLYCVYIVIYFLTLN